MSDTAGHTKALYYPVSREEPRQEGIGVVGINNKIVPSNSLIGTE